MTNDKMADTEPRPDAPDEEALRRRLINRIALAGVAIVVLLGGLAIIDSMYVAPAPPKPKDEIAAAPLTAEAVKPSPAPVEEKPAEEAPYTMTEAPEPPTPEAVPSIENTAPPEESSSPAAPAPRQLRPLTKMPEVRPATATPAPAPEPARKAPAHAPASRPLTQAVQTERQFVLQVGVFKNLDNAQELLAKLQKAGVPAQIEARVQVGPFKNKAEAEEARGKLKTLGLDSGLLMPLHH